MDEMLSAQKSSWEEKEKLSKQLEEERHNNVNAAIGQVMHIMTCRPELATPELLDDRKVFCVRKFPLFVSGRLLGEPHFTPVTPCSPLVVRLGLQPKSARSCSRSTGFIRVKSRPNVFAQR